MLNSPFFAVSVWEINDTITPLPITGVLMFDWFFTVVIVFGLVSFAIGAIVDVLRRS
jgi:hypothetical protein